VIRTREQPVSHSLWRHDGFHNLIRVIQEVQPDEIYNLAAQSHVQVSFETPEYTANADATGTLRLLEAIRILGLVEKTRFYQASTSELYGKVQETPRRRQRHSIRAARMRGQAVCLLDHRELPRSVWMHASNGILFNHESPIRGETFVTRKITRAVASIHLGLQKALYIGNLDSLRDWGHARDYVEGMWRILQQGKPDDYVLATGEMHSVREFIELAFSHVGRRIVGREREWMNRQRRGQRRDPVRIDSVYFRPTEVGLLLGDPSRPTRAGWKHTVKFHELVAEMVESDLETIAKESRTRDGGHD